MKELENGKLISTMSNSDIKIWIKKDNTLNCEFSIKNGGESYDILEISINNNFVEYKGRVIYIEENIDILKKDGNLSRKLEISAITKIFNIFYFYI